MALPCACPTTPCFIAKVIALISFRISHKIAGPIYRVRGVLESVATGDYDIPSVRMRKHDEFQELAEDLNKMISSLRERRDQAQNISNTLLKDLDTLAQIQHDKHGESVPSQDQSKESFAEIQNTCSRLIEILK